jgi:hypothetical protein
MEEHRKPRGTEPDMTTQTATQAPTAQDVMDAIALARPAQDPETYRATAQAMIAQATPEQVADMIASLRATVDKRDALRARLVAEPVLRAAVAMPTGWKDADARFDVAKRALEILEAVATKHSVSVDDLAQALVDGHMTLVESCDMHEIADPRFDNLLGGVGGFHAFRYRVKDALDAVTRQTRKAADLAKREREDTAWAAQGLVRCPRCDGQGGRADWPGFDCYDCGGRRALPQSEVKPFH